MMRILFWLMCVAVVATHAVDKDNAVTQLDGLDVKELANTQKTEDKVDADSLKQQTAEAEKSTQEIQVAAKELDAVTVENEKKANAGDELNRVTADATRKKDILVKEANAAADSANAEALSQLKTAQTAAKDQEAKTTEAAYKTYKLRLHESIKSWVAERELARRRELEAYKSAEQQAKIAIEKASAARDESIRSTNQDAEEQESSAAQQQQRDIEKVADETAQKKAKAAQDKANQLARELSTPQALSMLQETATPQAASETAIEKVAADADKAAAESDAAFKSVESRNAQKEATANAAEEQSFANADQSLQNKRQQASQVLSASETTADEKLEESTAAANAKFAKTVEIIKRTQSKVRLEASSKRKEAYAQADNKRAEAYRQADAELQSSFKNEENRRKQQEGRLRDTFDEETSLHQADSVRKTKAALEDMNLAIQKKASKVAAIKAQAAIDKQQALERAAISGPTVLVQVLERSEVEPKEASNALSSEQLAKQHESESSSDREEANTLLRQITQKVRNEVEKKKQQAVEQTEADKLAIADEMLKRGKLQVDERVEMSSADIESSKLAKRDAAERVYRLAKAKIVTSNNKEKVKATEEKNKVYDEATQIWEKEKQRARGIELDAFRAIEEQQAQKLKTAKDEQTAAVAAAAADRAANKKAAQEAKVRAFAAASEAAARAKAAATQAKASAIQALSAERAAADQKLKPAIVVD